MHILFLPSWYPEFEGDFSGSFFREQAEAFVAEGHRVGVLAVRPFAIYEAQKLAARPRGIRVAQETGIPVYRADVLLPVPRWSAVNLAAMERRWWKLYETYVADHGRPDVLHAHAMFPAGIIAHRLSQRTGIPFVLTEHRPSSMERLREPGMGAPARSAARASRGLVAVARGFARELNEAYGLGEGTNAATGWRYLPGLLSPQFQDIDVRPLPDGEIVFGHVSHLDPGKRVSLLIDAFAAAFPEGKGARLRIVGDSVHRAALVQQVAALGLTDRIEFVGAVPRDRIVAEFAQIHAFVLPSEAEAFGTVLWEAMACGVPLISTRTWAGMNAVTEQTGLITEIDDLDGLAQALKIMRTRASEYDPQLIRAACVEHCGREAFVSNYVDLYREVGA